MNTDSFTVAANVFGPVAMFFCIGHLMIVERVTMFPRSRGQRWRRECAALTAEVGSWEPGQHEMVVRWLDHASLSKQDVAQIVRDAGDRLWFYGGQDMYAAGWPLRFTRSDWAHDAVAEEERQFTEQQRRPLLAGSGPPPPADRTPALVVHTSWMAPAFAVVALFATLFLFDPAIRANPTTFAVFGGTALGGVVLCVLAWCMAKITLATVERKWGRQNPAALSAERAMVAELRTAAPDGHGVYALDMSRYPESEATRLAAVMAAAGWEIGGREDRDDAPILYLTAARRRGRPPTPWPKDLDPLPPPAVQRWYNAGSAFLMLGITVLIVVAAFDLAPIIGLPIFALATVVAAVLLRRGVVVSRRLR